jgi:hypothetical protein
LLRLADIVDDTGPETFLRRYIDVVEEADSEGSGQGFGRTVLANRTGVWKGGALPAEVRVATVDASRVNVVGAAILGGVAMICFVVLAWLPNRDTPSALLDALQR